MELSKGFALEVETQLERWWQEEGVYHYRPQPGQPAYAIDTPPPTVSGKLHMGHVYSYCQADIIARYWRMRGRAVFYPMGFDDNGLPTERLVEREVANAAKMDRAQFVELCDGVGQRTADQYKKLWRRLGLSVDWRHTYRTNGQGARRLAQWSFIELYKKDLVYRKKAPVLWCTCCRTAFAQAELEDRPAAIARYQFELALEDGRRLSVSTARPELLPACVAVVVDPTKGNNRDYLGQKAVLPGIGRAVPIVAGEAGELKEANGAELCFTFADGAAIKWWRRYDLPTIDLIGPDGCLTWPALGWKAVPSAEARKHILALLAGAQVKVARRTYQGTIQVHDRCARAAGYRLTQQWFVRVLPFKKQLLAAGAQLEWQPVHMEKKYRQWVENLQWDWCISRQRRMGVPLPLWYCGKCGQVRLAEENALPVDPVQAPPPQQCPCGGTWYPDTDVMDTWATSALSYRLAAGPGAGQDLLPMAVRPLGQELIRTWVFYSLVKALHHYGRLPWRKLLVSGWGLDKKGGNKLSKSKGGGTDPDRLIGAYSADAVRLWAASSGPGKDATIDEARIKGGAKLVNKLWNVARFAAPFIGQWDPALPSPELSVADRWILGRQAELIENSTALLAQGEWAAAKSHIEVFFWRDWADHYLEMAKGRLYDSGAPGRNGALYAFYWGLLNLLKLFAPMAPYRHRKHLPGPVRRQWAASLDSPNGLAQG